MKRGPIGTIKLQKKSQRKKTRRLTQPSSWLRTIGLTTFKFDVALITFFTKHGIVITTNNPVAIKLNAIGCHTIEQFLDFENDKDLTNELKFYDDASGSSQAIPRFVRDRAVNVWIYSHWRFKVNKEGISNIPNWSTKDWKAFRDLWTHNPTSRWDIKMLACTTSRSTSGSVIMNENALVENLLILWNKSRRELPCSYDAREILEEMELLRVGKYESRVAAVNIFQLLEQRYDEQQQNQNIENGRSIHQWTKNPK